jgi:hypothetical protein
MGKCNITASELADALDITLNHLVDICDLFDSDPKDDWELTEGTHFEWGPYKARVFSAEGAVEICNYLESNQRERPLLKRWKRWLLKRDQHLKGLMLVKRIQEISELDGQLVFKNGSAFLAPRACRDILSLGTRQDVLNRTFVEIQHSENTDIEPLKIGSEFFEDEQNRRYFNRSGLASISKHLGVRHSQKHRQEWLRVVAEYASPALEAIEKHEADRADRIKTAMDRVRRQARGRCQLTGRRQSICKFNLTVHHLFDKNSYPNLADVEVNLIAIGDDIHNHFHQWMGGSSVSCTVEDLERYVEEFSNSLFPDGNAEQATKVAIYLSKAKKNLKPLV